MILFDSQPSHKVGNCIIPILQMENGGAEKACPQRGCIFHYLNSLCSRPSLLLISFQKALFLPLPPPQFSHPSVLQSPAFTSLPGHLPMLSRSLASPVLRLLPGVPWCSPPALRSQRWCGLAVSAVVVGTYLTSLLPAYFRAIYLTSLGPVGAPVNSSLQRT